MELQATVTRTTLGMALVAGGSDGICALLLGDDEAALRADLRRRFPRARFAPAGPEFRKLAATAMAAIEGTAAAADVPLDPRGTPFQQAVWEALRAVPPGRTTSYRELAAKVGRPDAVRAVGQAVGANPIAVLVPCHRAIRSDGSLSGYRWGVERKRALLAREIGGVLLAEQ